MINLDLKLGKHRYIHKILQSPQFNLILSALASRRLYMVAYMLHKINDTVSSPRSTIAVNNRKTLLHQIILVLESEFHK
jgi:hypothetical protein